MAQWLRSVRLQIEGLLGQDSPKVLNCVLEQDTLSSAHALTVGYLLGTYSVRKSSQESLSTQQIPVIFYGITLILGLLAPFIRK